VRGSGLSPEDALRLGKNAGRGFSRQLLEIVDHVHLARSTRNLLEIVETIGATGARFQSLSEPWANTTTHAGKMIMTVFAGIAEFERDLIRERTGAGRADAKKRGVRFGRPKKMNADQRDLAQRLLKEGKSVREVARSFSVHPATLYRILGTSS
jgi:DNA invertase Pin-like site-specific DNA recombinase